MGRSLELYAHTCMHNNTVIIVLSIMIKQQCYVCMYEVSFTHCLSPLYVTNAQSNMWHTIYWERAKSYSPTLYSQITGKYASVESKIFPHILLLCSISYSCFNGLTINQHFIKPLQGEKCSYLSVVDLSIVLPRVFFFAAMWAHQFTVTLTCTNANETVAIDVLVVVYNKTWENRVMLTLHGQLVLDIRPRC